MVVSGVISLIAAYMYFGMKSLYIVGHAFPTEMRYVDWLVTTPLMLIQFSLLIGLRANSGVAWKLFLSDIFMIVAGYLGETQGFQGGGAPFKFMFLALGMTGWLGIIVYLYKGILEQAKLEDPYVRSSVATLTKFVTFGWLLYPIGYLIRATLPDYGDACQLVYNIGDLINKVGFGAVIYLNGSAALQDAVNARQTTSLPAPALVEAGLKNEAQTAKVTETAAEELNEAADLRQMQQQLLKQMRTEADHKAKVDKLRTEVELEISSNRDNGKTDKN